ncbi:MAG: hypothetical protein B6242_06900 [Anaerolineaceae bacterium 4572_78]|nr:MAG: hypothetical protein B6242_06900 [Anaerolineaceae bacterium 4572_78]
MEVTKHNRDFGKEQYSFYRFAFALCNILIFMGLVFMFTHHLIFETLLKPLFMSVNVHRNPTVLTDTLDALAIFIERLGPLAFGVAFIGHGYLFCWRYFTQHLPISHDTTPHSMHQLSSKHILSISLIIIFAFILRWNNIHRSLDYDEIYSTVHFIRTESLIQTITYYRMFNNHIGYSIMARLAWHLFGNAEWVLRLPALIFGLASLYAFWQFVNRYWDMSAAYFATFLLAISPMHVQYSVSARGYAGMIFATILATSLYFQLMSMPNKSTLIKWIIVNVLGIYIHIFMVIVIIMQLCFTLLLALHTWNRGGNTISQQTFTHIWKGGFLIVLFSMLCYAPVMPLLFHYIGGTNQIVKQQFLGMVILREFGGEVHAIWLLCIVACIIIGLLAKYHVNNKQVLYFAISGIVPVAILPFMHANMFSRFFVYLLPFFILFFAFGVMALYEKWKNNFLRLIIIIFVVLITVQWINQAWSHIPESQYRQATIIATTNIDDSIGVCAIGGGAELFQYYSKIPIYIPISETDFDTWRSGFKTVRCLQRMGFMESAHQQLAQNFKKNATVHPIGNIKLYAVR